MNLAELLALIEAGLDGLSDDELDQLDTDLAAAMEDLLGADTPSDDALAEAEQAADAIEAVRAEQGNREAAATARADRAQQLRDRVRAEDDAAEGAEGGDDGEPAAEHVPAEDVEVVAEPEAEPIAAAGTPARRPRVAARRSTTTQPPLGAPTGPTMAFPQWGLVAAANVPGVAAGTPINDYDQLANVFAQAFRLVTGPGAMGPRAQVPLVRAGRGALAEYGEPRFLDRDSARNASKVRAVVHPDAITASGGICAPSAVQYDQPVVGSSARPVRDTALARFGADRGGIRTLTPPTLADVTGAIGIWTNDDDIAAGVDGGPTKPCLVIDCPDETETLIQAITTCFRTGNFRQRFFPEQVEAVMRLIAVAAARVAETQLLQQMKAECTAVTAAQLLGTARDLLPYLDQATAAFRDRWRLDDNARLRLVLPRWVREAIRSDIARGLPGDPQTNFAVADAAINGWLSDRSVNVTWAMEATTAAGMFGAQAAGALTKWPATYEAFLYPEGTFLFLDGGSLDLGLMRDSALASTNDLQFFAETSEAVHFRGPEALCITVTHCPDGSIAGTTDINPCA